MALPRIFIGSSAESLTIAGACNTCLDHNAEVTVWPQVFDAGDSTLTSLLKKTNSSDYALFIFSPDDITIMRGREHSTIRDNVIFELGLFIGALGSDRCFILKPRDTQFHLPSDLLGINVLDFNANREDGDEFSAVNAACTKITKIMKSKGRVTPKDHTPQKDGNTQYPKLTVDDFEVSDNQLLLMSYLFEAETEYTCGYAMAGLKQKIDEKEYKLNISIVKLNRAGFVSKELTADEWGNEYYVYTLTQNGVEYVLDNESRLDQLHNSKEEWEEIDKFLSAK